MLSVEEAYQALLAHFAPLAAERAPLSEACGRVLAEDVVAGEAIPPFDNSAMDGYAVRRSDLLAASTEAPVTLQVLGEAAAGHGSAIAVLPGTALRIMTGAPMPAGADAVVMREDTVEHPEHVVIGVAPDPAEHIRRAGEDIARGSLVLAAGTVLNAAAIGVLASIGVATVSVHRRPRVALLATGDELVSVDSPLGPGQIRNSSAYALFALVTLLGATPVQLGIARDERDDLMTKLKEGAAADLLITTGGVSVGDHDLVRELLTALGQVDFWRVNMQPGKPLAFGHLEGTPVIGLPGNPVSSLVAFELFARPAIRRLAGHRQLRRPPVTAALSAGHTKRGDRRQFLRASVQWEPGGFVATLAGAQGSHQLSTLARANALAVLPEGPRRFEAGEAIEVMLLEEGEAYARRHSDPQ